MIQFYELAVTKYDNDWIDCNGLNMWYMFLLSLAFLAIYRLIAAFLVFKFTEYNIKRLLYQLFDFEIFMALRISFICNNVGPCNPQRWFVSVKKIRIYILMTFL